MAPVQKVRSGESLSEEDDYEDDYDNDDEDESEEDTRKKTPGEKRSSTNGHKTSDSAKRVKRFVAGFLLLFLLLLPSRDADNNIECRKRIDDSDEDGFGDDDDDDDMEGGDWRSALRYVHSAPNACFLALSLTMLVDACGIAERPDMTQESINIEWMTMIKTWNPRLDRCPKKKSERAFLPPKTPLALPRTGEY
jgi:hypothetical protein